MLLVRSVQQLSALSQTVPDFLNYLVYILACSKDQSDQLRQLAGLVAKSFLVQSWNQIHPSVKQYIQYIALQACTDESLFVRTAVGILVWAGATQHASKLACVSFVLRHGLIQCPSSLCLHVCLCAVDFRHLWQGG